MKERCIILDGFSKTFAMTGWRLGYGVAPKELADALLDKAGVACLAGTAFGAEGEGYLRFSYANSVENIKAALDAMRRVLPQLTATAA